MEQPALKALSQRELRNESGRVLRAVSEGESFIVTKAGIPVGKLVPLNTPEPSLKVSRPARRSDGWKTLGFEPKRTSESPQEILDDLRNDRL